MTDDHEKLIDALILRDDVEEVPRAILLLLRDMNQEHRDHSAREMRLFKICALLLSAAVTVGTAAGKFAVEDYVMKTALLRELKERVMLIESKGKP